MGVLNRRGFDFQPFKNETFIHPNEMEDFAFVIKKLKETFKCKVFLIGISLGGNHGSKMLGKYGD